MTITLSQSQLDALNQAVAQAKQEDSTAPIDNWLQNNFSADAVEANGILYSELGSE